MRKIQSLILAILTLLVAACAAPVSVDYERTTDFSRLRNFHIDPDPVGTSPDPRVDTAFMRKRIMDAIAGNLLARGYTSVDEHPDFRVRYHFNVRQEIESSGTGFIFGVGTGGRHSAYGVGVAVPDREISSYDNLVLTIDIVQANSGALLWRGTSQQELREDSTPGSSDKLILDIVGTILKKFPPGR